MKYLLDTCVVSELANHRPDQRVVGWLCGLDSDSLYLSFVSIGELAKGIAKRGGDARGKALESWLHDDILDCFAHRILPVDQEVALKWGCICGEAERFGRPRPALDALIAATALVHGLTVATRNVNDMKWTGVSVFNPFA